MKLQFGRRLHTTFHTARIQSCCYLALKKKLIKLKHSLLDVPNNGAPKIWKHKQRWVILMKASVNWIIMFLFTIPYEVVCKHFAYFLGTANLKKNSLLVRTISIVIFRSDKWRIHFLVKLHDKPCLTACLTKIKALIGKHFFRYFKENFGTHLTHFSPVWPFM